MKTSKDRDEMVTRATAMLKKYPTFVDLPAVGPEQKLGLNVNLRDDSHAAYIEAMYEACKDASPLGRRGKAIVGK